MEQHDGDPTTNQDVDPWERFSVELSSVSSHLKRIYREAAGDEGPTEEEIKQAFATLSGTWEQVGETASRALRDERVRESLKRAASTLAAALGATLTGLGDQLGSFEEE